MNNDILYSKDLEPYGGFDITFNALIEYADFSEYSDDMTESELKAEYKKLDNYEHVFFYS